MPRLIAALFLTALLLIIDITDSEAQRRVTYQQLAMQHRNPAMFIDHNVLKADSDADNVWFNFRFSYEALNFRQQGSGDNERFEAQVRVSIHLYELSERGDRSRLRDRVDEKNALKTLNWTGSARASTFDQTKDAELFLNGNLAATLPPGRYAYEPRITFDGRTTSMRTPVRMFTVPDFSSQREFPVYFTRDSEITAEEFPLVNYGRSVRYAEDFNALFVIPDTDGPYSLVIEQLRIGDRDTSRVREVFRKELGDDNFRSASAMRMRIAERDEPRIRLLRDGDTDINLAFVTIPNRTFENAHFVMRLHRGDETISTRHFRSLWPDIPISLLNVDVAIRMMEPIVDRETFRELRRGNERERMRKFREFWKERDPEPETDYNPLMVEFYRRVDIAFDRFTTPNFAGFETDQGKTYIRFGEPESVQRRFPSGRPAVEVWKYENQEFVFEATSGFGEYRLRERNSL